MCLCKPYPLSRFVATVLFRFNEVVKCIALSKYLGINGQKWSACKYLFERHIWLFWGYSVLCNRGILYIYSLTKLTKLVIYGAHNEILEVLKYSTFQKEETKHVR